MSAYQSKRTSNGILAALAFCAVCVLVSCSTAPHVFTADPLAIFGDDARWYAVLPVEENRPVFEAFGKKLDNGTSFMKDVERADVLYVAGMYDDTDENKTIPFSLVATGSFPASMSSLAFSKKDGWEKMGSRSEGVWFRNDRMAVAIPRAGLLCMSDPDTLPGMLDALRNPSGEDVPVPPEFRDAIPRSGSGDGTIALYVRNRQFITDFVLKGTDLDLPIQGLLVLAKRLSDTGDYQLVLRIYFSDERTARAMVPLMRLVLTGTTKLDGTTHVLNLSVTAEDIAKLLEFVYF